MGSSNPRKRPVLSLKEKGAKAPSPIDAQVEVTVKVNGAEESAVYVIPNFKGKVPGPKFSTKTLTSFLHEALKVYGARNDVS